MDVSRNVSRKTNNARRALLLVLGTLMGGLGAVGMLGSSSASVLTSKHVVAVAVHPHLTVAAASVAPASHDLLAARSAHQVDIDAAQAKMRSAAAAKVPTPVPIPPSNPAPVAAAPVVVPAPAPVAPAPVAVTPAPVAVDLSGAPSDIVALIHQYFPASAWRAAEMIVWRESRFEPQVSHLNSNGTVDRGLFQLNDGGTLQNLLGQMGQSTQNVDLAFDPAWNVQAAALLFSQRGWQPWGGDPTA